jgi:hypothetical protein
VLPLLNGYCFFKTCDGSAHYVLGRWDMLIAFPPCTYLTNASAVRMRVKGEIVAACAAGAPPASCGPLTSMQSARAQRSMWASPQMKRPGSKKSASPTSSFRLRSLA